MLPTKKRKHKPKAVPKGKPVTQIPKKGPPNRTSAAIETGLRALQEHGVVQALQDAKRDITQILHNSDEALAIKLAVVYGAGQLVSQDESSWNALCSVSEWAKHPKLKPKRTDPLRAVLRLAVGFDGKRANSTVFRYYKALNPLFVDKVPAAEIPQIIREMGGIEKMRQSAPRSIEVVGAKDFVQMLYSVKKLTRYSAAITVKPSVGGITEVKITKLKELNAS